MATTVHGNSILALVKHLKVWAENNGYEVDWPDAKPSFDADKLGSYLRADFIPASGQALTFGFADEEHLSIFQVTLITRPGKGAVTHFETIGEIANHFAGNTTLVEGDTTVCVYRTPVPAQPLSDGSRTRYPISIPIQVLT